MILKRCARAFVLVCAGSLANGQTQCPSETIESWVGVGISSGPFNSTAFAYDLLQRREDERDVLYACGAFTGIGNTPVHGIARLVDGVWEPVGAGQHHLCPSGFLGGLPTSFPFGMSVVGNDLLVAGTTMFIDGVGFVRAARWDGQTWHALDAPLATHSASQALPDFHDIDEYKGALYAGALDGVYRWDDTSWAKVVNILGGFVVQVEPYNGDLYFGGQITNASVVGGPWVPTGPVGRYDGSATYSIGVAPSTSGAITRRLRNSDGLLYVAGQHFIPGLLYGVLSTWNGDEWGSAAPTASSWFGLESRDFILGTPLNLTVRYTNGQTDSLQSISGGALSTISEFDGIVRAIERVGDVMFVAGEFTNADGKLAMSIAQRSGDRTTTALGGWLPRYFSASRRLNSPMLAEGAFLVSSDMLQYVEPGGAASSVTVTTDGVSFSPLGSPDDPLTPSRCFELHGGDSGVLAFGFVPGMGAIPLIWDGEAWALAPDEPLPESSLGYFTAFNRPHFVSGLIGSTQINALEGNQWVPKGPTLKSERLDAATEFDGSVVLCGRFINFSGQECPIALLKDNAWTLIPGLVKHPNTPDPPIRGVANVGDSLVMYGQFESVDGLVCNGLAQWNGESWQRLGGLTPPISNYNGVSRAFSLSGQWHFVESLSPTTSTTWRIRNGSWESVPILKDRQWVVQLANGKVFVPAQTYDNGVLRIAEVIACSPCRADCDQSGDLNVFDLLCFQSLFAISSPEADCDGSGALDVFDYLCFVESFAQGC